MITYTILSRSMPMQKQPETLSQIHAVIEPKGFRS